MYLKIRNKAAGFSLLELMVVVAILGVLATVAVPRFNIFRARARQAEAKTNMGVIFSLQESFAIEHESYYNGDNTTWGGTRMNRRQDADGYRGGGNPPECRANKLGFRLANCEKSRYGYFMGGANETEWLAVAYAPSDTNAGGKRIFPGCDGTQGQGQATAQGQPGASRAGASANLQCIQTFNNNQTRMQRGAQGGDAWCIDQNRNLENYFDIVERCEG